MTSSPPVSLSIIKQNVYQLTIFPLKHHFQPACFVFLKKEAIKSTAEVLWYFPVSSHSLISSDVAVVGVSIG